VERTGVHLDVISQLRKTSQGKGYEEGARITLQDLRGSGSLGSVPNIVIAMERDRQDPEPIKANTSVIRVLKNRFTGRTGVATALHYDANTGKLNEIGFGIDAEGEIVFDPEGKVQTEPELKALQEIL
jgi:twinkle protein